MEARVFWNIELLSTIFFHVQCVTGLRNDCKIVTCGFKLTAEHSAQIAINQYLGSNEANCVSRLRDIDVDDLVAVYCPDEPFCGIDLHPEYTKQLKPIPQANCSVFAMSLLSCEKVHDTLLISGKFSKVFKLIRKETQLQTTKVKSFSKLNQMGPK